MTSADATFGVVAVFFAEIIETVSGLVYTIKNRRGP